MLLDKNTNNYVSAQNSIEDDKSRVHHFNEPVCGYVIQNDGETDIKITVINNTFTVKPKEQLSELFTPFTAVEIDTMDQAVPYRAYGRG